MNLKWRCLITLVSGMVFVQGPVLAIDCGENTRMDVVGVIYDARGSFPEEVRSRLSDYWRGWLDRASSGEDTRRLFFVPDEQETHSTLHYFFVEAGEREGTERERYEAAVQYMAPVMGRRVKVRGCVSISKYTGLGPVFIDNLNEVELLE